MLGLPEDAEIEYKKHYLPEPAAGGSSGFAKGGVHPKKFIKGGPRGGPEQISYKPMQRTGGHHPGSEEKEV